MSGFSANVVDTITRFGDDLGVDAAPGPDGAYTFNFSHWGSLSIESSADGRDVLVSLSRAPRGTGLEAERRLLALAGPDALLQQFLHVGLTAEGNFCLVTTIDLRIFDIVSLNSALRRLVDALDSIE